MQQCRAYLCTPILHCAALLLPSHTHLKDELGPKLLPLAIVDLNICKGKCGPGLFNKNLQTAPGLPLCLSLLLCSGQGCLCPGGGRSLPWVLCPTGLLLPWIFMASFVWQFMHCHRGNSSPQHHSQAQSLACADPP